MRLLFQCGAWWRAAAWSAALVGVLGAGQASANTIEAYASNTTVTAGDSLDLHVRCTWPQYKVSVWHSGRVLDRVLTVGQTYAGVAFAPAPSAWELGCGWPVTCRIPIPREMPPGAYLARIESGTAFGWVPFVVRARVPGSYSKVLVQLAVTTWQAYNTYGGKSLYKSNVAGDATRAYRVSFQRPYCFPIDNGSGQFFQWEEPFMEFLERERIPYEVCTSLDLHSNPHLLDPYRLFVSVGHDEYWSKEMFDALETFVDGGGNLAVFAGNVLWWQVRFEDQGRTMVCYKDAALDPMAGIDPVLTTVNWHSPLVHRFPARLTGLYYNGSYGISPGGFKVLNPRHWAFQGVHVDSGQVFGYPMVAYEVDAIHAASPAGIELVARADLLDHNNGDLPRPCDMTYYERTPAFGFPNGRGGKVFAAGTVNYAQGLTGGYNPLTKTHGATDPVARQVTLNVIDRLGCSLFAPQLTGPADNGTVRGNNVMLQWYAAATQRFGYAVQYQVHWRKAGDPSNQVATTASLGACIPVEPNVQYEWWVDATSACGAVQQSAHFKFAAERPTDSLPPDDLPALQAHYEPGHVAIQLALERPAEVKIGIYDSAGRRVYFFDPRRLAAGVSRIEWDLTDRRGRRVPSGLYFVRAWVDDAVVQTKLVVLR